MKTIIISLFAVFLLSNAALADSGIDQYMKSVDSLYVTGSLKSKNFPSDYNHHIKVKGHYFNQELVMITTIERTGASAIECNYYVKDFSLAGICESVYPPIQGKLDEEEHYDSRGNQDYSYINRNRLTTTVIYGEKPSVYIEQYGQQIKVSKKQRSEKPEQFAQSFRKLVNAVALTLK